MNNLADFMDEIIGEYYNKNNNYPQKIIMNQLSYDKLILACREQEIDGCWIDKKEKNYKGILINITEIDEIKLE